MWCIPEIDEEFVSKMVDVLELYARPLDPTEPVVALDERPTVLHDSARPSRPMRPRRVRCVDYEYVRCGTANIFCIVEPKAGRHFSHATPNRTRTAFARALNKLAHQYPHARVI